ncbi:hypothetical protein HanPI659440_Chr06g0231371 [Helianthus annuus]|nr:hypothetical protein HanPI659440_Chr06g0231371 [Helianthus annuus]
MDPDPLVGVRVVGVGGRVRALVDDTLAFQAFDTWDKGMRWMSGM